MPSHSVDKAFAINVNLFWVHHPSRELVVLRRSLRRDGILEVLYGAGGPTAAERVASRLAPAATPADAVMRAQPDLG